MIAPFFDAAPGYTAIPIGIAFGIALERAGFGLPKTIAAQLAGRDFTVMKVMFTAIVTAMLGLYWTARLGWLDPALLSVPPTDLLPQLIGAVVFGAGFAIASLCPGTACVAAGTGRRDGIAAILGLLLGTLVVAEAWPVLGIVAENQLHEGATIPQDFGIATGIVVAVITGVAFLAVRVANWFEKRHDARAPSPTPTTRTILATAAGTLALLAIIPSGVSPAVGSEELGGIARDIESEADHVAPMDLAQWIHDRRPGLRIIDVRNTADTNAYQIPGSETVPLTRIASLKAQPGETLVLYSDGGAHAAQAWVILRLQGIQSALVLRDGLAGWQEEVLSPPLPDPADTAAVAAFVAVRSMSRYFGGKPRLDLGGRAKPLLPTKHRRGSC